MEDEKSTKELKPISVLGSAASEISSYTRQRFGHPLFYSFILSFIACNWRSLSIFMFSNKSIETIIPEMEEYLKWYSLAAPLAFAFSYTLGFPYLKVIIDKVIRKPVEEDEDAEHRRTMKLLGNQVEHAAKLYDIASTRSGTQEIAILQATIDSLSQRNDDLLSTNEQAQQEVIQMQDEINTLRNSYNENNAKLNLLNAALENEKSVLSLIQNIQHAIDERGYDDNSSPVDVEDWAVIKAMTTGEINWVASTENHYEAVFTGEVRTEMQRALVHFGYLRQFAGSKVVTHAFTERMHSLREKVLELNTFG